MRVKYRSNLPLYLPAHGRRSGLPPDLCYLFRYSPVSWDLPELPNIGGPLESKGSVAYSQQSMAERWGACHGWYGVNGATNMLQVALLSVTSPGDRVLMPRNAHRSILSGCILGQLNPVLFSIPFDQSTGLWGLPSPQQFNEILLTAGDIACVVLLHPTYQGFAGSLTQLIQLAHKRGIIVIVDEAHGTHFSIAPNELPKSALSAGADLVIGSLHKSAGSLGQSAVLWLQHKRVSPISIERSLLWLQTSSPSTLLLASVEASLDYLASRRGYDRLQKALMVGYQSRQDIISAGFPLVLNQDPLRLVLNTAALGISGIEADDFLMKEDLIAELPEPGCLTFCLSMVPNRKIGTKMVPILNKLQRQLSGSPLKPFPIPPIPQITELTLSPQEAWRSPYEIVNLEDAAERIAADIVCPYPPGIPILYPGEKIDRIRASWLQQQHSFWPKQISNQIAVVVT
ncbi:Orn/Lys/Arg decarboxylase family 1 (chromatophore) [Paulinella micropora]|uniref:Orn/Lys/Arg decarboxylase family 1 n=1 Tax=Paulinella micropora TaxID=1928728 RepID=A0A1L5YCX5_9EUKA|nr:Orn/Lys/Arg decarboxylase family 1 [Paulinella micropora]AQX45305.1 Orn/Lys/Arg decarboxylase family 1 [Paulinella micropora]BBL86523.1 Orn/Lys/Arg decarboxylase family 1 [Paulinella micropora]